MAIGKRWLLLLASCLACAVAQAQVPCVDCKATALADASQCRAQAAPDAALLAICDRKYSGMNQACQETACRAEAGAAVGAQCIECVKQPEADTKKCAAMPPEVRAACEARVAIARKLCEEKACPPARPK